MQVRTPRRENKTAIMESLAITIGNRRKYIREESPTIAEIVQKYPRLRDYEGDMVSDCTSFKPE